MCVCSLCVCVCERERESEKESEKEKRECVRARGRWGDKAVFFYTDHEFVMAHAPPLQMSVRTVLDMTRTRALIPAYVPMQSPKLARCSCPIATTASNSLDSMY